MKHKKEPVMGADVLHSIISEYHKDDVFKKRLISDPENVISQFIGRQYIAPQGTKIKVVDQTQKNKIYINIPNKVMLEDLALTEEQLDKVAGGLFGIDDLAIGGALILGLIVYHANDFVSGLYEGFTDDI